MTEVKENKWYVIRAISGQENKIKTYIEGEIKRLKIDSFTISFSGLVNLSVGKRIFLFLYLPLIILIY